MTWTDIERISLFDGATLTRSGIRTMLQEVDSWVVDHIDEFHPFCWSDKREAETRRKALAELALYVHFRDSAEEAQDLREILRWVTDRVNDSHFIDLVERDRSGFACYAPAFAVLDMNGALSIERKASWTRNLDIGTLMSIERPANRIVEIWWLLRTLCPARNPIQLSDALRFSSLFNPPCMIEATADVAYSLTHNIMYAYDFGLASPEINYDRKRIESSLNGLLLRFLCEGHIDLAIELALSGLIISGIVSELTTLVIAFSFQRLQQRGGFGLPDDVISWGVSCVPDRSKPWAADYHTMLVFGALLSQANRVMKDSQDFRITPERAKNSLVVGEALASIAKYDFLRCMNIMIDLHASGVCLDDYRYAIDAMLAYIASQETFDGKYGRYPDELHYLKQSGVSQQTFIEGINAASESCVKFLQTFNR